MTPTELAGVYRRYIDCLNARDWPRLAEFVRVDAVHNGRSLGLSGYRAMLEHDVAAIPDLRFNIARLVCEAPYVAAILRFDCHPQGEFLGLPVHGRRVVFAENVFYEVRDGRIAEVWSVLDK